MAERNLPAVRPVERGQVEVVDGSDLLPSSAELATIQSIAILAQKSQFFAGSNTAEKAAMQILAGREYGIGPWQSLSGMHVINGRPTLAADTMAGLIQRYLRRTRGGVFRVVESTNERCVVEYRRPEWQESSFVEWTKADANTAGLTRKGGNWATYPRAMLRARATAEAARAGFPDICAGLYDPDELDAPELRPVVPADVRPAATVREYAVEAPVVHNEPMPEDDDTADNDGFDDVAHDDEAGDGDQIELPMSEDEQRMAFFREQMEAARSIKELKAVADAVKAANLPESTALQGLRDYADARSKAFRLTHAG